MTFRPRRSLQSAGALALTAMVLCATSACSSGGSGTSGSTMSATPSATTDSLPSGGSTAGDTTTHSGSASTAPSSSSYVSPPTGTQPPGTSVAITQTATFDGSITGSVDSVTAVTAAGVGPGQTDGPGLAVKITLRNGSSKAINLDSAVVNIAVGTAKSPGDPSNGAPSRPFSGSLKPGGSATATYVFRVDDTRGPVEVTVSYSPTAPSVLFTGSVS